MSAPFSWWLLSPRGRRLHLVQPHNVNASALCGRRLHSDGTTGQHPDVRKCLVCIMAHDRLMEQR